MGNNEEDMTIIYKPFCFPLRLAIVLLGITVLSCGGGSAGSQAAKEGGDGGASTKTQAMTSGYVGYDAYSNLYLTNTSSKSVRLLQASFGTGDDNADFYLYSFQVGQDSPVVTDVFPGAILAAGQTITFTVGFNPSTAKIHKGTFDVFYTTDLTNDGSKTMRPDTTIQYLITGNVLPGKPPKKPGGGSGDGNGGGEDDCHATNTCPPTETYIPATGLTGDERIKLTKMYAYMAIQGNEGVPVSGAKGYIYFNITDSKFTIKPLAATDGTAIPTLSTTKYFAGQPITIATTGAEGTIDTSTKIIQIPQVPFVLHSEKVQAPVGLEPNGTFEIVFKIDLTTGTVSIPPSAEKWRDTDYPQIESLMDGTDYYADQTLTGIYPESEFTIGLVGCSSIPLETVIAHSAAKSSGFWEEGTPVCVAIEGTLEQKSGGQ